MDTQSASDALLLLEKVTKRFGGVEAVSHVSFAVAEGEVLGVIGPNGAGKSTIMRILSCYLPATSGTVRVAGRDVFSQANEVRQRIGYMPENNPLYREMRVREYLRFRGSLKGLRGRRCRDHPSVSHRLAPRPLVRLPF